MDQRAAVGGAGPVKRGVLFVALALAACWLPDAGDIRAADLDGARAVFLDNIRAIQDRDTERYLSAYLQSSDFIALSPAGLVRGFESLAASRQAEAGWPDSLVASSPTLVWLSPGVVYGAYEYVARQAGTMSSGWSERVLVKTGDGWKIAVTSAIPSPQ